MANKLKMLVVPCVRGYRAHPNTFGFLAGPTRSFALNRFNEKGIRFMDMVAVPGGDLKSIRFYCKEESSPPNKKFPIIINKDEVERYFYRSLAFLVEYSIIFFRWSTKNFQKHVIGHAKVQECCKYLDDKMQKAKQN